MELEQKAINAALVKRNETSLELERWRKQKLENAFKSMKAKFPELTKDDKHLILAGHKFEAETDGRYYPSGALSYSMRSVNGYMPVYDLQSFGEYLLAYSQNKIPKEFPKTAGLIEKIYNFISGK